MKLFERLFYGINAAYRSRKIAINNISALFFWLLPEKLVTLITPYCRFRLGNLIFYARRADWATVNVVAIRDEYNIVECLLAGKDNPTIVDLGANIGMFSLRILTVCPLAVVHAVEPSLATYQILERNKLVNQNLRWHVYRAAVWRNDGVVKFKNIEGTSVSGAVREDGDEMVPAMSLATLFSTYVKMPVDILKLNIEGGEEAVICESQELLRGVEELIIEVHPNRCNHYRVITALRSSFDFLYEIPGHQSQSPLLLASRSLYDLPLWKP